MRYFTRMAKPTGKPNGRPRVEFHPEVIAVLDAYEGPGTLTELMQLLGIGNHIFYQWMKEEEGFSDAVMRVRARADDQMESAFYKRGVGYDITINEQRIDKDGCIHDLQKDIHVPGDTGAQLNWLKNRRRDKWTDRKEVAITGDHAAMVERFVKEKEAKDAS
ncbi:MAG: hypothetical protein KJP02_04495 [Octadecabacter sp.]|nr:hypothetical protein [Octadecabacter sp.]